MKPICVTFVGARPNVAPGDAVDVRDAGGDWHRVVARSEPRYDVANALRGQCHLTVAVETRDGSVVNWPAEDVRRAYSEEKP